MRLFDIAVLPVALVLAAVQTGDPVGARPESTPESTHVNFQTNARWCDSDAVDPGLKISACTWLLNSGGLSEKFESLAHANRGGAYRIKGLFNRAIQDYDQAIRLKPDSVFAYISRGVAYNDKGLYDWAIRDYAEALRLSPDDVFAHINLGDAYANKGQFGRAIRQYDQAIRLEPNNAAAYNHRGQAHRNQGAFDRAIEDFRAAKRLGVE